MIYSRSFLLMFGTFPSMASARTILYPLDLYISIKCVSHDTTPTSWIGANPSTKSSICFAYPLPWNINTNFIYINRCDFMIRQFYFTLFYYNMFSLSYLIAWSHRQRADSYCISGNLGSYASDNYIFSGKVFFF